VDYVTKPFNHYELIARVALQVRLGRVTRERETLLQHAMEERRAAGMLRLTAGVAHNFSNLLGSALGNFMYLERELDGTVSPAVRDALDDLRASLLRQQKMVRQFLRLAHGGDRRLDRANQADSFPPVALREVLAEVFEASPVETTEIASERWQVEISHAAMVRVPVGMVREACHLLVCELSSLAVAGSSLKVIAGPPDGGQVCCRFIGRGMPMLPEMREEIFEPFGLPLANVGTGLAFALVRQLMAQSGGAVAAQVPRTGEIEIELRFPAAGLEPEGAVAAVRP